MRHLVAIAGVALLLGCSPARVTTFSSGNTAAPPVPNNAAAPASNNPAATAPASKNATAIAPVSTNAPAPASSAAAPVATAPPPARRVDFVTQIRPLLESRCMPCHFEGGKVFDLLPFDRPQTIRTLGTKMFTRITDDAGKKLVSAFLAESASSSADE